MEPRDEIKKLSEEINTSCADFLLKAKEVNDSIPFIIKTQRACNEFAKSMDQMPPNSSVNNYREIQTALDHTKQLLNAEPMKLKSGMLFTAISGSATMNAATSYMTEGLLNSSSSDDPLAKQWIKDSLDGFIQQQITEQQIEFIGKKLNTLYAGSGGEFMECVNEYAKSVTGAKLGAAIQMRNVIEGLKGNLLQLARKYSSGASTGNLKFKDIVSLIAKGAPSSVHVNQLLAQESVYNDLHDAKLTKVAKGIWAPSQAEWEGIYAQFLGFLYSVLGLIDLRDGS